MFQCLWLMGALDTVADRPDRLGVMLDAYMLDDGSTGTVVWETEKNGFFRAIERLRPFARKWIGLVPPRPIVIRWYGGEHVSQFDGETIGPLTFELRDE